jgi:hypothetical protein
MSNSPVTDARLAACFAHDWKTSLPGPTISDLARQFEAALSAATERERGLREALEAIVLTHDMYCENHVGVSGHSYTLAGIARAALSEHKGTPRG